MLKAFWKYFHKKKNSEKTIFLFSFRFFESADDGATATKTIGGRELFPSSADECRRGNFKAKRKKISLIEFFLFDLF